ncbi:hypothetical protein MBLNU230_g2084t1 [Neophaeotheca triangularis]
MKLNIVATSLAYGLVYGFPQAQIKGNGQESISADTLEWHPAGPGDERGPCPMMNTLANHGFLPHDGRNITRENAIKGLGEGLNFDSSLASLMWDQAIIANPEPNATFFTLGHLNRHNVLEHDASLSRLDDYYGNNHLFNPEAFSQTREFWTDETLTAQMLANSKLARMIDSRAFNPNYTFSEETEEFSLGELAAPIIAFGDVEKATVSRALVSYFFEHERLPTALGWTVKNETMELNTILSTSNAIRNATNLFTYDGDSKSTDAEATHGAPEKRRRRNLHFGF